MAPVGDESSPSVPSLPTETLAHIASFLAPTLLHHWLPGARGKQYKQWKDQHKIITSLQIADRRFAAVCRPLVWRTVCFSAEDELHAGPAALMVFSDKQLVKEVRWETDSERLTDMSSQFLPLLTNLDSLGILYVNEQGYRGSNRFPRSLASTIVSLKVLRHLQLQDIRGFIGGSLDFGADLPRLESLGTGSWWHHGSASSTPGQLKRAHYILDFDIYDFDEQEAFFDVYLPRLHHLSLECYFPPSGRLDYHRLPSEASDGLLQSYDAETRQAWPLESLELSHMDLVESWEVHGLLETLGDSSKLHTLSFHDCPTSGGTSMQPWRFLTMPHIRSLKVHIGKPPIAEIPFQRFLLSFPGLLDLDVSNIFRAQDPLIYSDSTSLPVPTTAVELLAFARAETTLQRLTIRYPLHNEIYRFRRLDEGELDVYGYGFDVELWHEW